MSLVTHSPVVANPFPALPADPVVAATGLDLRSLVGHSYSVDADESLDSALRKFSQHALEFMPVLKGRKVIGLVGRQALAMHLSGRYGFALHARKPAETQVLPGALIVTVGDPLEMVFQRVFSRGDATFYHDVILVEPDGTLAGVIYVYTLVRLQNALLVNHVRRIERTESEIERKNMQMEDELKLAREMQAAFLPQQYPLFPPGSDRFSTALKFRHHYRAAGGVSGDFLHVLPLSDHSAGVFMCDVMGHGVRAALVTAMVRALLQELCVRAESPADLLTKLNDELLGILQHAELGMFATAMYMIVDVERSVMTYSIAGHAAPLHLRRAKGLAEAPGTRKGDTGPALGLFPGARYKNKERALEAGDAIVLFTDGLYEAENGAGQQFGRVELMRVIAKNVWMSLDELLDAVLTEVERFAGGKFDDDFCLLGVEIRRLIPRAKS